MSYDAWPSPEARRGPLPRLEDLPVVEHGYDQEAVRRAFDDFYRHAAQLDASLQALEAVEGFQRTAAELRSDLRVLQALDLGGSGSSLGGASYAWEGERARPGVSTAALRIAGEAAVIVAVGVIAGVSHLRAWVIVALMGAALLVVWLSEWLAARARARMPASVYDPLYEHDVYEQGDAIEAGDPAPYVEASALEAGVGWSAFEQPSEEHEQAPGPGELTMVEEPLDDTEEDATPSADESEPVEPQAQEPEPVEPQADESEPEPRRGWLRRRRRRAEQEAESDQESAPEAEATPAGSDQVRVLAAGDPHEDN